MNVTNYEQALGIIKTYSGPNNFISYFRKLYDNNQLTMSDFNVKYVLANWNRAPVALNKIARVSHEYGLKLQDKYNLEFTPDRVRVCTLVGELDDCVHCYLQFRESVPPKLEFIPRRSLLTSLSDTDYTQVAVDFGKYDKMTEKSGRVVKQHQQEAVQFLLHNKKCILADTCGLGKTLSCVVAAIEGGFERILVITTASLKSTWKREISYYCDPSEISIVKGSQWTPGKKFTIVNYDIVDNFYKVPQEQEMEWRTYTAENGSQISAMFPVLKKNRSGKMVPKTRVSRKKALIDECLAESPLYQERFDCVIIDEAHKLSNNTSIRYKTIADFLRRNGNPATYLVTGTPLTNKPINLYHILRLIDAEVTKDYLYYTRRYCGARTLRLKSGKTITMTDGATHLDELRHKIAPIYIRRLQSEIPGMVNKTISTRYYDLTAKQMARYNQLWDEYLAAQDEDCTNEEYRQLVEGSLVRQYLAIEMAEHTIELVDEKLEDDEKIIIICSFAEEIKRFKDYYGDKAVVYDGTMSAKQKDAAEQAFMTNPKVKVFIGQIIACSVGLTLTAARFLVFNSFSFVAADNAQAEDRIYRITATRDVNCIYQLFTDSISQRMYEIVMEKKHNADMTIIAQKDKDHGGK